MKDSTNPISEDTIGLLVHSYNNYLSGLMGFTELALMECEQEVVKERLAMSMDSGNEAVIFGKQLLSSIGRLQVALKLVDLERIFDMLSEIDNELQIQRPSTKKMLINTDTNWFIVCLTSIFTFCRDYSKLLEAYATKVSISAVNENDRVCITISNNFDLSEDKVKLLFNPFYTSRTLLGKKGVGLAMVKGFVEQMKGNIIWDNEVGFIISLPRANP